MRTMEEKLRNYLRLTDERTAQRDAARAEVEHLKRERDALQIRTQESEGAGWKARLRGDKALTERDEAQSEVERLKQELASAKRRADEWEYRAGEWMVRAEDAEAQLRVALEELAKVRGAKP